jgi:hypothetical protein
MLQGASNVRPGQFALAREVPDTQFLWSALLNDARDIGASPTSLRILAENSVPASSLAVDRLRIPTQRGSRQGSGPCEENRQYRLGQGLPGLR